MADYLLSNTTVLVDDSTFYGEIARVLKPGGRFVCPDVFNPDYSST